MKSVMKPINPYDRNVRVPSLSIEYFGVCFYDFSFARLRELEENIRTMMVNEICS